jgi:Anti-sigma-K factor rskA/Putative zinc-finger
VTELSHDDIAELLGAYALDAVDDDERALIDDHLRDCPRCRDEVAQHREVAAHLAFAGSSAPEGSWAKLAADLQPGGSPAELARMYPLRRPEEPRPSGWMVRSMLAAAAVLVVLVGALGWEVHTQSDKVQRISSAMRKTGIDQTVQTALMDPQATKFTLMSADGAIRIDAVLEPDGSGYLLPSSSEPLPTLPSSKTYQLWGVSDGQKISLGLLGPRPGVVAFRASAPDIVEVAITEERAGGVVQPTTTPVVTGIV